MSFLTLAILMRLPLMGEVVLDGERLQYVINWPSGLSLGEGRIQAGRTASGNWSFQLDFEAAIPGFFVSDRFASLTDSRHCSLLFEKDLRHGKRSSKERITFDGARGVATRETLGGGKSELAVPACARDALAFLFYLRRELAGGRIPSEQNVIYGAAYSVRLRSGGVQRIRLGEAFEETDLVSIFIQGPASAIALDVFFSKDPARTPVKVHLPLALGTLSMEIVR